MEIKCCSCVFVHIFYIVILLIVIHTFINIYYNFSVDDRLSWVAHLSWPDLFTELLETLRQNLPSVLLIYLPENSACLELVKTLAGFLKDTCYAQPYIVDTDVGTEVLRIFLLFCCIFCFPDFFFLLIKVSSCMSGILFSLCQNCLNIWTINKFPVIMH